MTLSREERLRRALEEPESSSSPAGDVRNEPKDRVAIPGNPNSNDGDALDPLRPLFVQWFDKRIVQHTRWSTGIATLHRNCCEWILKHDADQVPPDHREFHQMLLELGCRVCEIGDGHMVLGLALREDVLAHEQFKNPPPPAAHQRSGASPNHGRKDERHHIHRRKTS